MDIATHLLVPYAGILAAFGFHRRGAPRDRTRTAQAAVFGVSGFAPDLDGLVDPLSARLDALYWLQHRGASHSLVGAPFFALLLALMLAFAARRWPRVFGLFAWRASFVPFAVLGSWTHLLLDGITLSGVPLLWPFAWGRVGFFHFHWLVIWLLPIGAVALALHAFGRLSRPSLVRVGVFVVVALVLVAGARAATKPAFDDATLVFPRSSVSEWIVVRELPNGSFEAALHRDGVESSQMVFEHRLTQQALPAAQRAAATDAYRGFLMGSYGPRVVHAAPAADGAWLVTFTDVAQRYEALHEPRWTPTEPFEAWGYVSFRVQGEAVEVLHRGW